jgi:hypothetical protein
MKVKRAEGFLSVGPFLWSRPFSAYPVSLIKSKCTRRSYVMGRKLDQGIKGGEGNQKPEGRPKQPFIASNGQVYAQVKVLAGTEPRSGLGHGATSCLIFSDIRLHY